MEWTVLPFESFEIKSVLKSLTSNRYKSWNWKGNRLRKLCKTAPTMNIVIAAKTAEPLQKYLTLSILRHREVFFIISNLFPDFKTINRGVGGGGGRVRGLIEVCNFADPLKSINQIRRENFAEIRVKYFYYMQGPKCGPKTWMNLQSAAIAGSGNPLKSRFESEIRAKIFLKSVDPFAYSPPSSIS